MSNNHQTVIEAPGVTCRLPQPRLSRQVATQYVAGSVVMAFEAVKHLLCDRPLRRPNRTRPTNG